jgi:hypothetical protein
MREFWQLGSYVARNARALAAQEDLVSVRDCLWVYAYDHAGIRIWTVGSTSTLRRMLGDVGTMFCY